LKIDLLENGVQVPSSADISRAAGVHSADVVARFEEKLAEPKVLTALKEAQDFWAKNGDSIDALKERIATLKNELQPYVNEGRPDLIDAGFRMPQQELALRRDIFAGKPGATHENCLASVDNADLMPSYL
jgi:hypothetical protein